MKCKIHRIMRLFCFYIHNPSLKTKEICSQNLNCLITSSFSSSPISISVAMLSSVTLRTLVHFSIELVQAGLAQLKIVF